MKKRIGILVDHGVELRHFVLSGLVDAYRNKGNEVVLLLTKDFNTPFFNEYIEKFELETQLLSKTLVEYPASKWESRLRSLRDARKRLLNEPLYSHFSKNNNDNRFFRILCKIGLIYRLVHRIGLKRIHRNYSNYVVIEEIQNLDLSRLIMLQYGVSIKTLLGVTTNRIGLPIDVYLNTLKTPYINDFLPFRPSKLNSWVEKHADIYYSFNRYHEVGFIEKTGSPFHAYLRNKNSADIEQVCEIYGIEENRTLVLYSMIFEKVYPREHLIIEKIYNYFQEQYGEEARPQLAIRRNPFEEDDAGVRYLKQKCPKLIVCDHYWERDASKNWSLQSIQGEVEWKALLYRANLLLNIPSMSTIDAIMTGTMTGNIYFDEEVNYNVEVQHILESPFSKYFSKSPYVLDLHEISTLKDLLKLKVPSTQPDVFCSGLKEFILDL